MWPHLACMEVKVNPGLLVSYALNRWSYFVSSLTLKKKFLKGLERWLSSALKTTRLLFQRSWVPFKEPTWWLITIGYGIWFLFWCVWWQITHTWNTRINKSLNFFLLNVKKKYPLDLKYVWEHWFSFFLMLQAFNKLLMLWWPTNQNTFSLLLLN